jgi:hypothetical protein
VGLISWNNYFITQLLSLGDQRNGRKEKKNTKYMNLQEVKETVAKKGEDEINLRNIEVNGHLFRARGR